MYKKTFGVPRNSSIKQWSCLRMLTKALYAVQIVQNSYTQNIKYPSG